MNQVAAAGMSNLSFPLLTSEDLMILNRVSRYVAGPKESDSAARSIYLSGITSSDFRDFYAIRRSL
jgi:hypothetical protein